MADTQVHAGVASTAAYLELWKAIHSALTSKRMAPLKFSQRYRIMNAAWQQYLREIGKTP